MQSRCEEGRWFRPCLSQKSIEICSHWTNHKRDKSNSDPPETQQPVYNSWKPPLPPPLCSVCDQMSDQTQQQNVRTSALSPTHHHAFSKVSPTCQVLETGCCQGVNTGAHSWVLPHGSVSMCSLQPFMLEVLWKSFVWYVVTIPAEQIISLYQ